MGRTDLDARRHIRACCPPVVFDDLRLFPLADDVVRGFRCGWVADGSLGMGRGGLDRTHWSTAGRPEHVAGLRFGTRRPDLGAVRRFGESLRDVGTHAGNWTM